MSIKPYTKRRTAIRLNHVRIRLIDQSENEEWNALLEKHHYLANGNMVGPQLRYVAEIGCKTVGLIGFSNASLHLSARDKWIGWNDVQRDRRLGFVVQNSRFLILPAAHRKNMASKILSLCAKRIGDDWERLFHHPVLILETFTGLDKKRRGTGYLAAGWERVGETKGYTRDRRKFYTKSGIGKGVWCKELCPKARNILSNNELPEKYAGFEKKVTSDFARRKLGAGTLDSLREVLQAFDELPRKSGQRYLTSSCLAVLFCGIFAGCKGVRECCDFVSSFSQPQLRSLRMWRDPATKRYKVPSYVTVWRAIARTDPMEFERRILSWFNKEMGGGVRLVHIDGKSLRATMDEKQNGLHVVSAASFDDFFCGKP